MGHDTSLPEGFFTCPGNPEVQDQLNHLSGVLKIFTMEKMGSGGPVRRQPSPETAQKLAHAWHDVDDVRIQVQSLYDPAVAASRAGNAKRFSSMEEALLKTLDTVRALEVPDIGNIAQSVPFQDARDKLVELIEKDFAKTLTAIRSRSSQSTAVAI